MASEALYIIAVWALAGMGMGLMATAYGACRKIYRLWPGVGEFLDWFWFVIAAAFFLIVGFWTEWGVFRVWAVVFVLIGYLVWSWLAAPLVLSVLSAVAYGQARLAHYTLWPFWRIAIFVKSRDQKMKKPP